MPLPRIDSNIANVSMDYFLRGVNAAKPQGAQAPLLPEDNPPVAPEEHSAGKLVTQLDVLLMKAASASTKSLDGRTVRQTFQKLVDDGALDRNSLKLLAKTADTAAKTLKALDKFTGRELAGGDGADEAPLGTGKITVQKHGGQEKRLGGEIAKDVNELLCPSIFARDGIDKLFA
ncbi:MAG: hypothetical protein II839_02470 [Kiritimatiellae bacterium]|nr:hypothetical protein [Kiritimatiellia bacterium]